MWPYLLSLVLGVWLVVSSFWWPHLPSERANGWILGALIVVGSLMGSTVHSVRWINILFAAWLFFATILFPHAHAATLWNNVLVALALVALTFAPRSAININALGAAERRP